MFGNSSKKVTTTPRSALCRDQLSCKGGSRSGLMHYPPNQKNHDRDSIYFDKSEGEGTEYLRCNWRNNQLFRFPTTGSVEGTSVPTEGCRDGNTGSVAALVLHRHRVSQIDAFRESRYVDNYSHLLFYILKCVQLCRQTTGVVQL